MAAGGLQCPFADSDYDKILLLERSSSAQEGWRQARSSDGCVVWQKKVPDQNIHLVKGYLDFPGIPAEDLLELVYNLDVRKRYDQIFQSYEVVEAFDSHRITYAVVQFPPPLWSRDIVQYNVKRSKDDEHIVLYKNATHESRPVNPNYVRGETIFAGTIIRPVPDDPTSSTCTIFIQSDVKGWIPTSVVNLIAKNSPKQWQTSVSNFYHNTYKKEKESAI